MILFREALLNDIGSATVAVAFDRLVLYRASRDRWLQSEIAQKRGVVWQEDLQGAGLVEKPEPFTPFTLTFTPWPLMALVPMALVPMALAPMA